MGWTESGRYSGSVVDEISDRIFTISETGEDVFGLLTIKAFQADAFQRNQLAFQIVDVSAVAVSAARRLMSRLSL